MARDQGQVKWGCEIIKCMYSGLSETLVGSDKVEMLQLQNADSPS